MRKNVPFDNILIYISDDLVEAIRKVKVKKIYRKKVIQYRYPGTLYPTVCFFVYSSPAMMRTTRTPRMLPAWSASAIPTGLGWGEEVEERS